MPLSGDKTPDGERPDGTLSSRGRNYTAPPTRGFSVGFLGVSLVKRHRNETKRVRLKPDELAPEVLPLDPLCIVASPCPGDRASPGGSGAAPRDLCWGDGLNAPGDGRAGRPGADRTCPRVPAQFGGVLHRLRFQQGNGLTPRALRLSETCFGGCTSLQVWQRRDRVITFCLTPLLTDRPPPGAGGPVVSGLTQKTERILGAPLKKRSSGHLQSHRKLQKQCQRHPQAACW